MHNFNAKVEVCYSLKDVLYIIEYIMYSMLFFVLLHLHCITSIEFEVFKQCKIQMGQVKVKSVPTDIK